MQKDRIQIWENAVRHITNVTKYKTTYYRYDKVQIRQNAKKTIDKCNKTQMWKQYNPALGGQIANTIYYKKSKYKRSNTNMKKYRKIKHKFDNIQKNTNMT